MPALTRRFVLVLESGHAEWWSVGVLEYRAKSEKPPRSELGMPNEGSRRARFLTQSRHFFGQRREDAEFCN